MFEPKSDPDRDKVPEGKKSELGCFLLLQSCAEHLVQYLNMSKGNNTSSDSRRGSMGAPTQLEAPEIIL